MGDFKKRRDFLESSDFFKGTLEKHRDLVIESFSNTRSKINIANERKRSRGQLFKSLETGLKVTPKSRVIGCIARKISSHTLMNNKLSLADAGSKSRRNAHISKKSKSVMPRPLSVSCLKASRKTGNRFNIA